jgi:hypothetical protein
MKDWIYLRSMFLSYPADVRRMFDVRRVFGVCLPDGRFILLSDNRTAIATFSSERQLLKHHPGAELVWTPRMDETINHVADDEDA